MKTEALTNMKQLHCNLFPFPSLHRGHPTKDLQKAGQNLVTKLSKHQILELKQDN